MWQRELSLGIKGKSQEDNEGEEAKKGRCSTRNSLLTPLALGFDPQVCSGLFKGDLMRPAFDVSGNEGWCGLMEIG